MLRPRTSRFDTCPFASSSKIPPSDFSFSLFVVPIGGKTKKKNTVESILSARFPSLFIAIHRRLFFNLIAVFFTKGINLWLSIVLIVYSKTLFDIYLLRWKVFWKRIFFWFDQNLDKILTKSFLTKIKRF